MSNLYACANAFNKNKRVMRHGLQTIHAVLMTESKGDVQSGHAIGEMEKTLRTYPQRCGRWCRDVTEYDIVYVDDRKFGQI